MQQQEHHKESHYFFWAILETKAWRLTNRGHIPATSNKVNKSPISFTTQVSWLNSGRRSDPLVGNHGLPYDMGLWDFLIWVSWFGKATPWKRYWRKDLQMTPFSFCLLFWGGTFPWSPSISWTTCCLCVCQGHSGEHVMLSVLHEMRSWFKSFWFKS